MRNVLLVISGPSGVGKGTIANQIIKRNADFSFSISCTTRKPRRGEKDGKEYFFISKDEFAKKIEDNGFYVMIEGIEDPYNFGYSLRSLYAMGCSGIILTERNWMSAAGVVARSSAGASEMFDIYRSSPSDCIEIFKSKGYKVICADENTDNILGKCDLKKPILLIVGGEKRGISRAVVDLADMLVRIDYGREFRASLSAASATTMFAYEIARQN
jgi:23S rRNA (guanosine2251-2'-O)-methyltransferase